MVTRLDAAYYRERDQVRRKVLTFVAAKWAGLSAWRDADAERLIALIVPQIEAGQLRIAQLTDAYIARLAAAQVGGAIVRGDVAPSTTLALRGVPAATVFDRPFVELRTKLAAGRSLTDAVSAGGARLVKLTETGLQLSSTHATRTALTRGGVTTYRRVLRGEKDCALCVIASTQRYWRGDLLPIHPGCDCGVEVNEGAPNTQVRDPETLEQMHDAVEATFGRSDRGARLIDGLNDHADYLDIIAVRDHGEIGPVLTWREQHFSHGPDFEDRAA